jgi:hypothetical protein
MGVDQGVTVNSHRSEVSVGAIKCSKKTIGDHFKRKSRSRMCFGA